MRPLPLTRCDARRHSRSFQYDAARTFTSRYFLLFAALRPGGLVLLGACAAAFESASEPPLAFAIQHPANRLAAGGASCCSGDPAESTARFDVQVFAPGDLLQHDPA
jgi:hypothetical protein